MTGEATGSAGPGLAVVTGASSGIGLALARQFSQEGFELVIAAEDDGIEPVRQSLEQDGRSVVSAQVDLATRDGVETLYRVVSGTGRPVTALALNAGIAAGGVFHETDVEDDLRLVDLNCRSTIHLAKLVIRDMVGAGHGRVLVTSSIAAAAAGPYNTTYAASKAFVHWFAEGIRHELDGTGVTVTSLMPGPTDTEIFARGNLEGTRLAEADRDDPADVAHDAYEAMLAGRDRVITGGLGNQAQVAAAGMLPDRVAAAVAARQTEPGAGEGDDD